MGRLRFLQQGLALILLVLITPSLASKEDACRTSCRRGRSQVYRYEEGTTYRYNFHSAIKISLASVKGQESTTHIKATALLTPNSPCSHLLRLQNVEVTGANSQRYSNIAGVEKAIQFSFEDGVIGDHICTEPDDVHNSLNIKRAVASLFQVDTQHLAETDVFGVCPTIGLITSEGGDTLITKTRDLDECAFRESIREDFMVSSFNPDSDVKTSPIMSGEYMSQQRIKNGIVDRVFVFENYTYLAFTDEDDGKDDLGALARVATKLEYAGTAREYAQSRVSVPKSIIFDNPHPVYNTERSNADSFLNALRKLRGENDVAVSEHSARDFLDLVKILRDSNQADMLTVFRQVKAGAGFRDREGARKMFLDALFRCGTGNAIVASIELLKSRELHPHEETSVYLGFAFVKHATLSSLEAATSLLQGKSIPREAYLGIGNLAGRYCHEHDCNVDAVNRLTQQLASKLGWGRVYNREEENEMIYILKALGNIRHLDEGVLAKVSGIASDKASPTRLRAAALDTYLSDPCHNSVRSQATALLKDIQEDSELRIKAYLVLAKCPNEEVARVIKETLNKEPSYQVGGFIVFHLRNLKASANPDKTAAQHYLGGISTKKNFPVDPRKYSFHGEFSYDFDTIGVSSSAEASVIYSQNSFLPRSTSLNLTAELFGHRINFLEVATRQQNLDRLLEHYFGPLGVFNKATKDELEESGMHAIYSMLDHFNKRLDRLGSRGKRDVSKQEIDGFGRQVQIRTNELNNELDLDLSIKLFGSELFFLTAADDTENLSPVDIIDRFFDDYERDVAHSRQFDKNYQSSTVFLDTEFSYPTSMGFPLRLSVEGTSSAQVKAKGTIDLPALLDDSPNGGLFKLSLIPSANIQVAASITLDAQLIESGLKVVSSLYTATGGDLELNLQDRSRGMEVKYSLPLRNQKLISATHEVVFNTRELAKPEVIEPLKFTQNKDMNVCLNDLVPFIGLNLCADVNSPTAYEQNYVLAGNYKFALGIVNEDFGHVHYKEEYHNDYRRTGAEVSAEVVGARQNKKMSLKLEAFSVPDLYVKGSLVSPITTASIEGRVTNTQQEKSVSYEITQDGQQYKAKIGVLDLSVPRKLHLKPILEFSAPGAYGAQTLPISVGGAIVAEERSHDNIYLTFENLHLRIEDPTSRGRPQTYSLNGNMGKEQYDYFADLKFSDGYVNQGIDGRIHLIRNLFKLDGKLTNDRNPDSNVHVTYEFKRGTHEIDSILQLIHGRDLNSQHNKLKIVNSVMFVRPNDYDFEVETKNEITYPAANLDIQIDYKATPVLVIYAVEFKYEQILLGSELDVKHSQRNEKDYNIDFTIYDSNDKIELKAVREVNGDVSRIDNVLVINGQKYQLSGTVTMREHYQDAFDLISDLQLALPQKRDPLKIQEELKITPDQTDALLKITDGYDQIVDFTLRSVRDNSNADLKINLRDLVNVKAHGRQTRGTGNAEVTIDFVQTRQTIKADASITVADPTYNVRFTLYPDFQRNRGAYVSLRSDNQIREGSIESKNTFDKSGQKTLVNAGYTEIDHDDNGKVNAHLEVTMPDGDFASGKYNFAYTLRDDHLNSEQSLDLVGRGIYDLRNAKLSMKQTLKDVNEDLDSYDYTYTVDAQDDAGFGGHALVSAKRVPQGEKVLEEARLKVRGREEDAFEVKVGANYDEDEYAGSYDALASYLGGRYSLGINGKYDLNGLVDDDEPLMEEIAILVKTPDRDLESLKLTAAVTLKEKDWLESHLDLIASAGLAINEGSRGHQNHVNVKGDAVLKVGAEDGEIKLTATSQNGEPISLNLKYDYDETATGGKLVSNVVLEYDRYKKVRSDLIIDAPNEHECDIEFGYESPETSPLKVKLKAKESEDGQVYVGEAHITHNNNRYELIEEIDLRDTSPTFNVQLTHPNRQVDQVLVRAKLPNSRDIEGEVKIHLHQQNFALDGNLKAQFASEEDFNLKLTANCRALEIHDFILTIQNRGFGSTPQNLQDRRPRHKRSPDHAYGESRYGQSSQADPRYQQQSYHDRYRQDSYQDPNHGRADPYNSRPSYDQRNDHQDPYQGRADPHNSRPSYDQRNDHQDPYQGRADPHNSRPSYDQRNGYQDPNRRRDDPYNSRPSYDDRYTTEHNYDRTTYVPPLYDRYGDSSNTGSSSHGEQVQISAQHAGRNLLSGGASYTVRRDTDRVTIEGSGTFTYKQERPRSHNYKVTVLSSQGGQEYTWNVKADSDELDGQLRVMDDEVTFLTTLCEQRTQCMRLQLGSKVHIIDDFNFEIEQVAIADLRSVGWHSMGITEKISLRGSVLDAHGELYIDQASKYQYKVFNNDRAFGASITTPARVIALDGKLQTPWGGRPGPSNFEVDFFLNKNHQPHQKTSLVGVYDCRGGDDVGRCNVEVKLTNPLLQKDLSVVYTSDYNQRDGHLENSLVLDVFKHANNKIVIHQKFAAKQLGRDGGFASMLFEVKSQGLQIDVKYAESLSYDPRAQELKIDYSAIYHIARATYDSAGKLHVSPQHALLHAKVLNRDVVNIDSKFTVRGDTRNSVTNVRVLGTPPSIVTVDVSPRSFIYSAARLDNPSEKVEFTANVWGELLGVDLKYYERGRPIDLLSLLLTVNSRDEVETIYKYDRHSIQRLIIEPSKAEYANLKRELGYIKESASRDLTGQAQQADWSAHLDAIDLRPVKEYYRSELRTIARELESDRGLQDILRFTNKVLAPAIELLNAVAIRIEEAQANSQQSIDRQYEKLMAAYEREFRPWLEQNGDKIVRTMDGALRDTERFLYIIVDEISQFVHQHETEIKEYGGLVVHSLEEAIVFAVKLERAIERELMEELNKLYREIKNMAIFEELQQHLEGAQHGRPVPESYIQGFRDAMANLKDSTDCQSFKKFITVLAEYIEQKLRRQPVDDVSAIQNILYAAFEVLDDVYEALGGDDDDYDFDAWDAFAAIPKVIEAELSPLTYLLKGDWPEFEELLESASLDLDDYSIPEDLDAVIAQGQHIFTFDNKHLTFPGSCSYLLARDAVNGNFSIVGSYSNGQLASITFSDHQDAVTIRSDGQVLLNQAPTELPVRRQHRLEVRRTYESLVISSRAGVEIVCGPKLLVCGVHVSGYYHAQLRGLLGNGNNEPYDDYTLPNGVIVTNAGEFGNAYQVGGRCGTVQAIDHDQGRRSPTCTRLFGSNSDLSTCYGFIDPAIYRTACDHGVAAGVPNTELAIAIAYVASCQTKDVPVEVPSNFVSCTNYEKPVRVDEEFTVTTPGRAADIVIIVDQDKANEPIFRDLLQPLTSQLTSSLGSKGISDVDFHVIGYGGEYEKNPVHYTMDGKMTFKGGRTPNVQFTDPLKESERETFMEYIERLEEEVELLTGQDMLSEAYYEAMSYPFRPHAVKSIIVLNSKPCAEAEIEPLQALGALFLLDQQLTVNLFTPFKNMNPHDQQTSNIVGFGEHKIFTFSNPEGVKERHTIESDNLCVEFALKNRGNVYVVNNFVQGRSKTQFVQVAADSIAKKLTHMEQWLDCKCEMVTAYTAQNVCEVSYQRKRQTAQQAPRQQQQQQQRWDRNRNYGSG